MPCMSTKHQWDGADRCERDGKMEYNRQRLDCVQKTPEMICAISVIHSHSHTLYSSIAHLRTQRGLILAKVCMCSIMLGET